MSYPMKVEKLSFNHQGGTKSYYLTLVIAANGNSILIKRWGKVGALGQCKIEQYPSGFAAAAGAHAFTDAIKDRQKKGYRADDQVKKITVNNQGELQSAIGRTVYPMVGSQNLQYLDPQASTAGVRDPKMTFDPDTGLPQPIPKRTDTDFLENQKKLEEDLKREALRKEQETFKSNPLYGRF